MLSKKIGQLVLYTNGPPNNHTFRMNFHDYAWVFRGPNTAILLIIVAAEISCHYPAASKRIERKDIKANGNLSSIFELIEPLYTRCITCIQVSV